MSSLLKVIIWIKLKWVEEKRGVCLYSICIHYAFNSLRGGSRRDRNRNRQFQTFISYDKLTWICWRYVDIDWIVGSWRRKLTLSLTCYHFSSHCRVSFHALHVTFSLHTFHVMNETSLSKQIALQGERQVDNTRSEWILTRHTVRRLREEVLH